MQARAPLLEDRAWNCITTAKLKKWKDCHEAWKVAEIANRSRNDA
jgi:hypothetical protein